MRIILVELLENSSLSINTEEQTDQTSTRNQMPKLSEFFGIKITMYADEHGVPHFHANYQSAKVVVGIQPLTVLAGSIDPRQFGLVMEWAAKHQPELMAAWARLQSGGTPEKIAPLN